MGIAPQLPSRCQSFFQILDGVIGISGIGKGAGGHHADGHIHFGVFSYSQSAILQHVVVEPQGGSFPASCQIPRAELMQAGI